MGDFDRVRKILSGVGDFGRDSQNLHQYEIEILKNNKKILRIIKTNFYRQQCGLQQAKTIHRNAVQAPESTPPSHSFRAFSD